MVPQNAPETGTFVKVGGTTSTLPFTWATSDEISIDFLYELA
jgi:hypothetical protein